MPKSKVKKIKRAPSFIVRKVDDPYLFGDVPAFTIDKAKQIAAAEKLLYKGKYAIYKLEQVVK